MARFSSKSKKQESSIDELKDLMSKTKFSDNILRAKNMMYNNLVKKLVENIDYIIVCGVTFYLTKTMFCENCTN